MKGGNTDAYYLPSSDVEAAQILREASATGTPLTIQGAMTGVVGGAVPFGGWAMGTEKMSGIIDLEPRNDGTALLRVLPGTRLTDIAATASENGYFYPPNPSEINASIGGNVSTDASGSSCFKYGSTRNYVERLKVILSTGSLLEIERGRHFPRDGYFSLADWSGDLSIIPAPRYSHPGVKSSAGYFGGRDIDLIDLFIGSEGTLGFVSEIGLKLLPYSPLSLRGINFYSSRKEAFELVKSLRASHKDGSMDIRAIEFIDQTAFDMTEIPSAPTGTKAAVMLEMENGDAASLEKLSVLSDASFDQWIEYPASSESRIIDLRRSIPARVNEKLVFEKMGTDLILPFGRLDEFVNKGLDLPYEFGVSHAVWGHIGHGQFHINLVPQDETEYQWATFTYFKLARTVLSLGGSVAAEHGIGKLKHDYLFQMFGHEGIDNMRGIKRSLDPEMILGRGNIFKTED